MNYLSVAETAKSGIFLNEACEITAHKTVFRMLC